MHHVMYFILVNLTRISILTGMLDNLRDQLPIDHPAPHLFRNRSLLEIATLTCRHGNVDGTRLARNDLNHFHALLRQVD